VTAVHLDAWYVTGIVEGEGSFCVSFNHRSRLNVGIETRPSFSITLSERDRALIELLQDYFKCGAIRYSRADRTYKFEVRSVEEIVTRVVPQFRRYPLRGSKRNDFELFALICALIQQRRHLDPNGLREIIELAFQMNPSGKRRLAKDELLRVLEKVKV